MNPPAASPHFRKTLLACGIAAIVESLIVVAITEPPILIFVLGPLVFLFVIALRRRSHAVRARRIHGVAVGVGTFGIASFVVAFLMGRNNPEPVSPPLATMIVPLVQWAIILWVWIAISRQESAEKRQNQPPSA
jgi:hypothetical protein